MHNQSIILVHVSVPVKKKLYKWENSITFHFITTKKQTICDSQERNYADKTGSFVHSVVICVYTSASLWTTEITPLWPEKESETWLSYKVKKVNAPALREKQADFPKATWM